MLRGICRNILGALAVSVLCLLMTADTALCGQTWQDITIGKAFSFQSRILKEVGGLL